MIICICKNISSKDLEHPICPEKIKGICSECGKCSNKVKVLLAKNPKVLYNNLIEIEEIMND